MLLGAARFEDAQPDVEARICMIMRTSQCWPIGTTGALWFAFLLIIGHYVAMFGVGGVLAVVLGVQDRREIWHARRRRS